MDPHQMIESLLPTRDADNGSACMKCMKSHQDVHLVKCAACQSVRYCGKSCQKSDWRTHKPICNIIKTFKLFLSEIPSSSVERGKGKSGLVNLFAAFEKVTSESDGPLPSITEKSWQMARRLIMASPCCAICKRTWHDRANDGESAIEWKYCSCCHYGWACAQHYDEYMASLLHSDEVCSNYIELSKIELFRYNHTINQGDRFIFQPEQALYTPMKSFPKNWEEYFQIRCNNEYNMRGHLPKEFFPASTFLLSQVNTILYGMYLHDRDYFTNKTELTVHVLGPSSSFEYEGGSPTCIWEEIMHCLPSVKTMKVIFIGPEGELNIPMSQIGACPDCISNGRVRMQGFYDMTYHDYRSGEDFIEPDFVAAYNTGMYDEYTESWKQSLGVLLDLDVPCIFTSYNKLEGEADLDVLREVGANTLSEETTINPFHVQIPMIDDNFVDKFFYCNMYYICFKGRK